MNFKCYRLFLNEIWLCVNDKCSVNEMLVKRQLIVLTIFPNIFSAGVPMVCDN